MAKCEFCDKGVTFGIRFPTPTAVPTAPGSQREAREGDREGNSHSRVRLHQMPPFR